MVRIVSFALLIASTACATANDPYTGYPSSAPAASAPGNFAGLYAGADIGAGIGSAGEVNTSGYVGGAHVGYALQAGRVIFGAEVDTLTSNLSARSFNSTTFEQKFLSTARGRLGYVFADLAIYATGGLAYATSAYRDSSGIARSTIKGIAYGAGVEWSPIYKVGVRVEALRYDFGSAQYTTPMGAQTLSTATNMLRAGAHYRF
jgi:outer membrane immunogenic protein